jgi:hypothetical protein
MVTVDLGKSGDSFAMRGYVYLPEVHKIASLKKIRHYKSKSNIFMKIHIIINGASEAWMDGP